LFLIFESILPIFLVMLLGIALKRWPVISDGLWEGLEQLGYYVLFPALLLVTLYRADFSGLAIGSVTVATLASVTAMALLTLACWPLLRGVGILPASFTSIFQTVTRWNAFIALAVADKLYGDQGLALVALVMALIIIPINFFNVSVLLWFGTGTRGFGVFVRRIVTNPLILGCVAGIVLRFVPGGLYEPVTEAIDLLARAALGLGLLMVGAGLKVRDALLPRPVIFFPMFLKLLVYPAILVALALALGVEGEPLMILALCGAVPTAMNGYLLARQMGGDAPLYAAITTLQTAFSFLTMPLVLAVTAQFTSG
jgi:predicted permease